MIEYNRTPISEVHTSHGTLQSFCDGKSTNIDEMTVESFGEEWSKFNEFSDEEISKIGDDYFDVVPWSELDDNCEVLDIGCGSGRWAKYIAPRVGFVEAVDPSRASIVANTMLRDLANTRVSISDIDNIPFPHGSFDLVYSLGVLHHIPDTKKALIDSVKFVKSGGYFLVYLYYALDNRNAVYKTIFFLSNVIRKVVSRMPAGLKKVCCDILAAVIYLPMIAVSRLLERMGLHDFSEKIPLSYYKKTSWNVIRNDSLDRFGTPLEQRFSRREVQAMMEEAGLTNITFSEKKPFWHAIGRKQ